MASNSSNGYSYCPTNFIDQDSPSDLAVWGWRNYENDIMGLQPIGRIGSNNYSRDAASVRQGFKEYFNSDGAVEWQWELVNRTVHPYDSYLDRLQLDL